MVVVVLPGDRSSCWSDAILADTDGSPDSGLSVAATLSQTSCKDTTRKQETELNFIA